MEGVTNDRLRAEPAWFRGRKKGSFGSPKMSGPCLMAFRDKFYLYDKGKPLGEERNLLLCSSPGASRRGSRLRDPNPKTLGGLGNINRVAIG